MNIFYCNFLSNLVAFSFPGCWKMRNNMDSEHMRLYKRLAGTFGSYGCDSPWALIESAAQAMRENHGKGIEFVLWTG